jgi:uncharacterized lipoprotein YddW (UPF0748 family)
MPKKPPVFILTKLLQRSFTCFAVLLTTLLLRIDHSAAQTAKEIRGVWVHPSNFGPAKDAAMVSIRTTLDEYRRSGINTLMVLVKSTSGLVYFKSSIAQMDTAWKWDFFGTFLKEAQKRNMTVHPWFCVFTEGAQAGAVRQHPEWLVRNTTMETQGVVNPALEGVRVYERSLILELVRNYPVEWVHLDYIRYPCEPTEPFFSFDEETRKQFREHAGEDPLEISHKNSGNTLWNEWIEWNGGHVTQFVRELKTALKTARRSVRISAAVFPDADNSKVLIGQDWGRWMREKLVDMICPMLYVNNDTLLAKYVDHALKQINHHGQLCPGIGIVTAHNKNSPAGLISQIRLTRRLRTNGYIIFSSGSLTKDYLDALAVLQ